MGVVGSERGKSEHLSVKEQGSIGSETAASVSAEDPKSMYMSCEGIRSHPFLNYKPYTCPSAVYISRVCFWPFLLEFLKPLSILLSLLIFYLFFMLKEP